MIFEKVKHIISQQFNIDEDEIELDTNLYDDLNADSVDLLELVMGLEDEFGGEVDDADIEDIQTVEDAVDYIEEHMGYNI